ncbi:polysaccharide deacetylase family protein [Sporosarcina sp. Sa2YVA2]|uniref:Polysaccharide deacetylase family protein n=1 Tax=Sporosarcina quadrami TaxID=2762234 RepID=A0ABR8U5W3_9BACL|nr:polysaccharide deacetylase family protein [Sporosarcina quadrami]MBD7983390.1 polysaccharide deacetylase family protein [Sporosarcina quadrami]
MKKNLLYISLFTLMLLSACNDKNEVEQSIDNTTGSDLEKVENGTRSEDIVSEEKVDTEDETVEEETDYVAQEPLYELNPKTYSIEPIGDANPNVVLLTIDDAPDKRALDMAKTLKEMDVPAIFFVNGHFINTDEKKEILKELHDMGFVIGNHTKTHANLKSLSEEEQKEEIISVNEIVEEVTGERPKFFRAPFGSNTDYSRALAQQERMLLMNWSYGYDFVKEYMTKEAITDIMINTELLRNGSNLLMHDREWTADALEDIVNGLRDKGYEFVDPKLIKTVENGDVTE